MYQNTPSKNVWFLHRADEIDVHSNVEYSAGLKVVDVKFLLNTAPKLTWVYIFFSLINVAWQHLYIRSVKFTTALHRTRCSCNNKSERSILCIQTLSSVNKHYQNRPLYTFSGKTKTIKSHIQQMTPTMTHKRHAYDCFGFLIQAEVSSAELLSSPVTHIINLLYIYIIHTERCRFNVASLYTSVWMVQTFVFSNSYIFFCICFKVIQFSETDTSRTKFCTFLQLDIFKHTSTNHFKIDLKKPEFSAFYWNSIIWKKKTL